MFMLSARSDGGSLCEDREEVPAGSFEGLRRSHAQQGADSDSDSDFDPGGGGRNGGDRAQSGAVPGRVLRSRAGKRRCGQAAGPVVVARGVLDLPLGRVRGPGRQRRVVGENLLAPDGGRRGAAEAEGHAEPEEAGGQKKETGEEEFESRLG